MTLAPPGVGYSLSITVVNKHHLTLIAWRGMGQPQGGGIIGIYAALFGVASTVVALRLFARKRSGLNWSIDDGFIVLSWVSEREGFSIRKKSHADHLR